MGDPGRSARLLADEKHFLVRRAPGSAWRARRLYQRYRKGCDIGVEFAEVAVRMAGEPGQYRAKEKGGNEPGIWARREGSCPVPALDG